MEVVMEPQTLLNEKQAAKRLGVGGKCLQAWRVRGGGPVFLKVGRLVRYTQSDLETWLLTRRRESTSDTGKGR